MGINCVVRSCETKCSYFGAQKFRNWNMRMFGNLTGVNKIVRVPPIEKLWFGTGLA